VDITSPQRERVTQGYLEMLLMGFRYSWRKMEAAAQDRAE